MSQSRKTIGVVILSLVTLILVVFLIRFIHHRMRYAVTNAVFVETDRLINLGFEDVSGRISQVIKNEGETVNPGEVLAKLEKKTYQNEVDRLSSELEALKRERAAKEIFLARIKKDISLRIDLAKQDISRLKKEYVSLGAQIKALRADIDQLRRDQRRYKALYQKRLIPKRRLEEIETNLKKACEQKKALLAQQEALKVGINQACKQLLLARNQRRQIAEVQKELSALEEKIKALEAGLEQAKLRLDHCLLKSPIKGLVAKRFHVAGDVVGPGEPVYALVDPQDLYILVLLEETKLHGVRPGCPAKVKIDAYPDRDFEGVVEEVLPATAAKFALVPRDISAGEFTKVAQRVPIRIRLTKGPIELLRVGLGGEVEIKRYE